MLHSQLSRFTTFIVFSQIFGTAVLKAQDEVTPPVEEAPSDVELPPPPEPGNVDAEIQAPADSLDIDRESIPAEVQADADQEVTGPPVDDRYNSLNYESDSIFSQVYIGPTVQIGFPQPLTYGLEALVARTVSFGFSTGTYTIDQIDKAELEVKGWSTHVRWHPWLSSFFIGAAYGHMEIDGKFEDEFKARVNGFERDVKARVDASIKTDYIAPKVGWFAVYESGLTFGFEVGAQIPLGPDSKVSASLPGANELEEAQIRATEDYKDLEDQADEAVKVLGKRTLPIVTLLKVGWLF